MMRPEDTPGGGADNTFSVTIERTAKGFGFNIKGTTQDGGQLNSIGGKLYPPLQYVSAVDTDGAAYEGGLRVHDRILEVNGVAVVGAKHEFVVKTVVNGGGTLSLRVLRVTPAEAVSPLQPAPVARPARRLILGGSS